LAIRKPENTIFFDLRGVNLSLFINNGNGENAKKTAFTGIIGENSRIRARIPPRPYSAIGFWLLAFG
jgi:hypothetical protein